MKWRTTFTVPNLIKSYLIYQIQIKIGWVSAKAPFRSRSPRRRANQITLLLWARTATQISKLSKSSKRFLGMYRRFEKARSKPQPSATTCLSWIKKRSLRFCNQNGLATNCKSTVSKSSSTFTVVVTGKCRNHTKFSNVCFTIETSCNKRSNRLTKRIRCSFDSFAVSKRP